MMRLLSLIAAAALMAGCDSAPPQPEPTTPAQFAAVEAAGVAETRPDERFVELPPQPEAVEIPTELTPELRRDLITAIANVGRVQKVLQGKEQHGRVEEAEVVLDRDEAEYNFEQALYSLSYMSESIPTYALMHKTNDAGQLEAWLITPEGGVVRGVSEAVYDGLGTMSTGLGVRRLAASRSRVERGQDLPTEEEIRAAEALDRSPQSIADRRKTLTETAELLLPGVIRDVLGTRSGRLLVIPTRDTGTAPYAALPLANGYGAENWSFVLLPDFAALASEYEPTFDFEGLDISKALIVGNPDLSDDTAWNWSSLPGAEAEARAVKEMLGVPDDKLLVGKEATSRRLQRELRFGDDLGLVYIASHAVSHPRNPLTQGYVAMSQGHYFAGTIRQEIFPGWKIRNPLVVLSACQTALGRFLEGGGFGIARTWTTAGAGQVIGSLWNVSDAATKVLMTNFVKHMKDGHAPEFAMQMAQLDTMRHQVGGKYPYANDPKMWASFTVFGKPSATLGTASPTT